MYMRAIGRSLEAVERLQSEPEQEEEKWRIVYNISPIDPNPTPAPEKRGL